MIRIYKNNDIKYVTKGAYESFYRPLGYNKVIETPVVKPKVEKPSPEGIFSFVARNIFITE